MDTNAHKKAHSSGSVESQEALHVSSCHELQQDEAWQDLQTDANAAHNVLMAELAVDTQENPSELLTGRTSQLDSHTSKHVITVLNHNIFRYVTLDHKTSKFLEMYEL